MRTFKGIAASRGIAVGTIAVAEAEHVQIPQYAVADVEAEVERYEACRTAVDAALQTLAADIAKRAGVEHGEIFEIQREFVRDPSYGDEIASRISSQKINAEQAVSLVSAELTAEFSEIGDEYFAQRAADIRDLSDRMVRVLMGVQRRGPDVETARIVLAHDLSPSDTASMDLEQTLALCTEVGGKTSHTAILSRSLGIPSIVGLGSVPVETGTRVIVDAIRGELIVDPDDETVAAYGKRSQAFAERKERLMKGAHDPARTVDGVDLVVAANIGNVSDAQFAKEHGAEGSGLLRTEFLFLDRDDLPDEEEQYETYRQIVDVFPDQAVIIRTLDVGGDKELPAIEMAPEQNPFLGRRALRLAFSDPDRLLMPQLRAALRAGVDRSVKLMFPMVGSVAEVVRIREYIKRARRELTNASIPFAADIEIGVMIEIPSAALIARHLATYVDFFSIGTNDLTQYTLAVDRTNETVAHLADYFHPAVVGLIATVVDGARAHGRWVGMCGEMAGDELAIPLLIGLGLSELSMAGTVVPDAKDVIRNLDASKCKALADRVLAAPTAAEARGLCETFAQTVHR